MLMALLFWQFKSRSNLVTQTISRVVMDMTLDRNLANGVHNGFTAKSPFLIGVAGGTASGKVIEIIKLRQITWPKYLAYFFITIFSKHE